MTVSEYLDSAAKVAGITATAGLLVSITYDWGMLAALGITFADVPTSIGDHLRSGLVWTTYLMPIALSALIFGLLTRRIEQGMTEDELVASSPAPRFTKAFRRSANVMMIVLLVLAALSFLLFGMVGFGFITAIACAFLWQIFAEWVFSSERLSKQISKAIRLTLYFVPAIGIFAFVLGFTITSFDVRIAKEKASLYLTEVAQPICVAFSRVFSEGVLVVTCQRSLKYLPWSGVHRIESINAVNSFDGYLGGVIKRPTINK